MIACLYVFFISFLVYVSLFLVSVKLLLIAYARRNEDREPRSVLSQLFLVGQWSGRALPFMEM